MCLAQGEIFISLLSNFYAKKSNLSDLQMTNAKDVLDNILPNLLTMLTNNTQGSFFFFFCFWRNKLL